MHPFLAAHAHKRDHMRTLNTAQKYYHMRTHSKQHISIIIRAHTHTLKTAHKYDHTRTLNTARNGLLQLCEDSIIACVTRHAALTSKKPQLTCQGF